MKGLLFDTTPENVHIVGKGDAQRVDFHTRAGGDIAGWRTEYAPQHVLSDDAGRSTLVFGGDGGKTLMRYDTDTGVSLGHYVLDAPAALQWTPENKYANMAPIADGMLALNALGRHTLASFDVDTRVKWRDDKPVAPTSAYTYSPGITLSAMMPSVSGKRVVVGDAKGVVRIYNDATRLKRADHVLDAMATGEAITSVDVSCGAGGAEWVAWTTASRAFIARSDSHNVAALDVPPMKDAAQFTTITFDNNGEDGRMEHTLVATGAHCVVRWKMRNIAVDWNHERYAQPKDARGKLVERQRAYTTHAFEHGAHVNDCDVLTADCHVSALDIK